MDPILGEIRLFAGIRIPENWAVCDGTILNVSANEALFSLIGAQFGGNGQTTFALPDLRGRLPIGQGAGPGTPPLTPRYLAQTGGDENASLVEAQIPMHNHAFNATTNKATTSLLNSGNALFANPNPYNFYANMPSPPVALKTLSGDTVTTTGSGGNLTHENRMPAMGMNYIIALLGTYPTRP